MPRTSVRSRVPKGMQVQLARLLGESSVEARLSERTPGEWRRALRRVLKELERYLDENVTTDEQHRFLLATGLWAAQESLKEEDFWPGYVEGITRFALLLLGDYPDHRKRRRSGKRAEYYKVNSLRSVVYSQSHEQRVRTLFAASAVGLPKLSAKPRELWRAYMAQTNKPSYREFLQWFRKQYPDDYAAVV